MSIHHLDPNDTVECPNCDGTGNVLVGEHWTSGREHWTSGREPCRDCHGTGRVPNPEGATVETHFGTLNNGWNWRCRDRDKMNAWQGPYPNEAAALAAARHAAGVIP